MIGRVEDYFKRPVSPALLAHFRDDIGLTGKYRLIFDDLRACSGSTQLHADNVGLTKRAYCDAFAVLGPALVDELLRMAEECLAARNKKQT